MKRLNYLLLALIIILSSFKSFEVMCRKSGISGHVYLEQGNRMPSPDLPRTPPTGVKTKIYIYEVTNISQVTRDGESAFYRAIPTKLIQEIESKEDGSFKIKLKPGTYSLFVKKGDLFYSSVFDSNNNIHPVEVKKGKMTEDVFKVNYDAVY